SREPRGTGRSNTRSVPAAGTSSPVSAASRVDLPVPEGPSTAVMLPAGTVRSRSRRMVRPPRSRRTPCRAKALAAGTGMSEDVSFAGGGNGRTNHAWGKRNLNLTIEPASTGMVPVIGYSMPSSAAPWLSASGGGRELAQRLQRDRLAAAVEQLAQVAVQLA